MKNRSKILWCVTSEVKNEAPYFFVYAFSGCHALNLFIKYMHEVKNVPLDDIDTSKSLVYIVDNFIK